MDASLLLADSCSGFWALKLCIAVYANSHNHFLIQLHCDNMMVSMLHYFNKLHKSTFRHLCLLGKLLVNFLYNSIHYIWLYMLHTLYIFKNHSISHY